MSEPKEIIFDTEAREKLVAGIAQLAEAVRGTLGPKGRNVALEKSWGAPMVTNDGHSIVKDIELEDQFANMGVAIAKEVASKLKDVCGDGTTTATLLLDALVQLGMRGVAAGHSPIGIKRGMDKAVAAVIQSLESMTKKIDSFQEMKDIATVSASGNDEIGEHIAQALESVCRSGVVSIEESKSTETSRELVEGMRFDRGYLSPYFATDQEKMVAELHHPLILITDKKVTSIQELIPILQVVASTGKELLLVAEDLEADVLATLVVNKLRGNLRVVAIKAPGFGDRRKALLEDLAILTGATVISEEVGLALKETTSAQLGTCDRVVISKDTTTLVGGSQDHKKIEGRIAQIEAEIEAATNSYDKEKLVERKAKLKGGVVVIRVGAPTEPELKQRKQMFEDSLNSTQAALSSGVVPGAGVALFRAATQLKLNCIGDEAYGVEVVRKALEAPIRQIIVNTGYESSVILSQIRDTNTADVGFNARSERIENLIAAGVIDPMLVVTNALIHAASAAGTVLLSAVLIGDVVEKAEA